MYKKPLCFFIIFFFIHCFIFASNIPYFIPPKGWECALPPKPDPYIQIAFLGKGQSDLRPSLNLAIEEIDVPLKEYLKSVREIHETEMKMKWTDLGPFTFNAGKGRLAKIVSSSPLGDVIMLQGIFVQDNKAYILTGAVSKEEFSSWQKTILDSLHSLSISPDLLSAVTDHSKRSALQKTLDTFNRLSTDEERQTTWASLQKTILADYAFMGSYWQLLLLKEEYKRLFTETPVKVQ